MEVRNKITYYFILFISMFLSSCVLNTEHTEYIYDLETQIDDLEFEISEMEDEISEIEYDLYIAHSALRRIKQCNCDTDSISCIVNAALSELGEMRFYKKGNFEIDILTSRHVDLDTAFLNWYRPIRHREYQEGYKAFITTIKNDTSSNDN